MNSPSLGIIGMGAFGKFMFSHLTPHFETIKTFDPDCQCDTLEEVCAQDIIIYAAPVQALEETLQKIAGLISGGQLFIDVCSVKVNPAHLMQKYLGAGVEMLGLHPLFGPQSGKKGIEGLNIALCDVRCSRTQCIQAFLEEKLGLNVILTTPEKHDEDMAYVMGVSHMVAKVFAMMDIPDTKQTTKTYELLCSMVSMIKDDSDELFKAIQEENPYVAKTKDKFFATVKELEQKLSSTES